MFVAQTRSGRSKKWFSTFMGSYVFSRRTCRRECRRYSSPTPAQHLGRHRAYTPLYDRCLIAGHGKLNIAISNMTSAIFGGTLTIKRAVAVIKCDDGAQGELSGRNRAGPGIGPVPIGHPPLKAISANLQCD